MKYLHKNKADLLVRTAFKLIHSCSKTWNSDGKRTDIVEAIRYDCINPNDFSTFTLKTLSIKPVITAEELEMSETPVYISIPVNDVVIKPYKIEYGIATVSIIAPYVKLANNEKA